MKKLRNRYTPFIWSALAVTVILFSVVFAAVAESDKEAAAVAVAKKWLAMVDAGSYDESYSESAEYFKDAVEQEISPKQWVLGLISDRQSLGKLISRKVISTTYTTKRPSVPDGEYVVILFETSFENKKEAIETIIPMIDKDKTWRVSAYFIK